MLWGVEHRRPFDAIQVYNKGTLTLSLLKSPSSKNYPIMRSSSRMLASFAAVALVCIGCDKVAEVSSPPVTASVASTPGLAVDESTQPVAAPLENTSDWPAFRGPENTGVSSATGLPEAWGEGENIAWKAELPGGGSSTPIVFNERIYLTAYSGYLVRGKEEGSLEELKRHLLCLFPGDGSIIWKKEVKAKLPEEERIRDHGYAANSVAVDEDRVYAFFGKSGVHAYDHQGNELWQADVGSKTHGWGTAASPVLYNDLVIINASVESQSLIALNKTSGKEVWRASGIKEAWNTPLIVTNPSGAKELVVAIHGKVLGFHPATGEALWSCDTDITWYMVPSPVVADGVVYYLGGRSGTAALAVRTGGRGDVTASHRLWTSKKGSNVTSPVYHDGHLYWMSEKLGVAYCAKAETGELVYEERISRAGQVYGSAILADGKVYYVSRGGTTHVVAAKPEFELIGSNPLRDGTQFDASPSVMGNRLLIRSNKHLFCIGEKFSGR